ncbi:MAG TPA: hypothetical protein DCQ93_07580 [Bacteroidetes bacterium]|nr:hypothetical protein [Bacteroidota bacterium]
MKKTIPLHINEINNRVIRISSLDESVNFEMGNLTIVISHHGHKLFESSTIALLKKQPVKTVLDVFKVPDEISLTEIEVSIMGEIISSENLFAVITFSHIYDLVMA